MNSNVTYVNKYINEYFKEWKLVLCIFAIIFFWATVYLVFFFEPTYKSKASLLIDDKNSGMLFLTPPEAESLSSKLAPTSNPLLNQVEILKSDQIRQALFSYIKEKYPDQLKYVKDSDRDTFIDSIIETKSNPGTDILNVYLKWNDPSEARDLLQFTLDEYIKLNVKVNQRTWKVKREFIDTKLSELGDKLSKVRNEIKSYKENTLAINIDMESSQLVNQKIVFQSQLENVSADLSSSRSSLNEMQNQLYMDSREALDAVALGSGNDNLVKLRLELYNAMQQYSQDSVSLSDTNPKMVALKNKIETIKSQIHDQIEVTIGKSIKRNSINILDPVRTELVSSMVNMQTKIEALKSEKKSLENTIGKINSIQKEIPTKRLTLTKLEQEEINLRFAYDQLQKLQIEARVKEAEAVTSAIIIDYPTLPIAKTFPKRTHVILAALLAGLAASFIILIIKRCIRNIIDGDGFIQKNIDAPVLGRVPQLQDIKHNNSQNYSLAYERIVPNLISIINTDRGKAITFTSTLSGKSTNDVYSCAIALKKCGYSVIVVDGDLNLPELNKAGNTSMNPGINLSKLTMRVEDKLKKQQEVSAEYIFSYIAKNSDGLDLLINNSDQNRKDFEISGFRHLINLLKEEYDWILVDSPAAISPESYVIAKLCDGTILITETPVDYFELTRTANQLKNSDIPILGTIIKDNSQSFKRDYSLYLEKIAAISLSDQEKYNYS